MRSDDEILALPWHALTTTEQERQRELQKRRTAEVKNQIAYLNGRRDAIRDQALADEELRELVRVRAWLETDDGSKEISFDPSTATFKNVPEGWPGVDGDEVVREFVERRLGTADDAAATSSIDETSVGLKAYRALMGD